jgi:hypothetical protein
MGPLTFRLPPNYCITADCRDATSGLKCPDFSDAGTERSSNALGQRASEKRQGTTTCFS